MATQGSGRIDQSVPSAVVDEEKFKELFSDRLSHGETTAYLKKLIAECIEQTGLSAKVDKCFTQNDYHEFEKTVEEISTKNLQFDEPKKKIKEYATEAAKDYFQNGTWNQLKFWVPVILSAIAVLVAYYHK